MNTINAVNDECYMEILCRKQLREMQSPRWRLELFKSFSLIILKNKIHQHFWNFSFFQSTSSLLVSEWLLWQKARENSREKSPLALFWLAETWHAFFFLISQSTWHLLQLANQVQRGPALSFARAEITERSIKHIFRLSLMSVLTG